MSSFMPGICAAPDLRRRQWVLGALSGLGCMEFASAWPAPQTQPADAASGAASTAADAFALHRIANLAVKRGLVSATVGWVTPEHRRTGLAGERHWRQGDAIAAADLRYIGSNGKAMTAMVIARLVEFGALSWGQRVCQTLPALSAAALHPAYAQVTLAQLLDHRAGVLAFTGSGGEEERFNAELLATPSSDLPRTLPGRRRYLADWVLRQDPPSGVQPGQDFHYSNAGYMLAACMAEVVLGKPFETLFETLLVQPLGLVGDWRRPPQRPANQPRGYTGLAGALEPAPVLPADSARWVQTLAPAGFWACDAPSYARWLSMVLAALRGENSLLPPKVVARLQALKPGDYALGWACAGSAEHSVLWHTGDYAGFMTQALIDQQGGQWAAWANTNTEFIDPETGASWVLDVLDSAIAATLAQKLAGPANRTVRWRQSPSFIQVR
jgi:D-alanyl-D-alanine carboxypeptidase